MKAYLHSVNIIGSGVMGKQISGLFLAGGVNVNIWNRTVPNVNEIYKSAKLIAKIKKLPEPFGKLNVLSSIDELSDTITIETVSEDINLKRAIYEQVMSIANVPYYSNTSSLKPNEIGVKVRGIHFFNPILLSIVEVYDPQSATSDDSLNLNKFMEDIGFSSFNVKNNRGYGANYLLFSSISAYFRLVEVHKYDPIELNCLYGKICNGNEILKTIDIIGVDVVLSIMRNLSQVDDMFYIPTLLVEAISSNVLGKKNKTSIKSFLTNR